MISRQICFYKLFTALTAIGVSPTVDVRDFKCAQVVVVGSNTAAFTVKIKGSLQETPPDFTIASSSTNKWAYVQFVDLDTGNFADNFVFAANNTKQFELNTNGLAWMALEISAYTTGTIDANATITNNL